MVPRGRPLIYFGYNYNTRKVLSFIVIDNSVSTQAVIPYLSKHPDQFSNVEIRPFSRPLVIHNFFGEVNEVDSCNKSRQSDLVLEKFWVTQCGWLCLFTSVAMGITINN